MTEYDSVLWFALEIEDICSQVCEHDVLLALQDLPETLTETFNRALRRIIKQKKTRIAKDIFKWIAAAKRPLLSAELKEALSIRVGDHVGIVSLRACKRVSQDPGAATTYP